MKRIRRITVEIVQRRQQQQLHRGEGLPRSSEAPGLPANCPMCGSPWVLLHDAETGTGAFLSDLNSILSSLDLHLQSTPAGQVWVCRRSYERLKETHE